MQTNFSTVSTGIGWLSEVKNEERMKPVYRVAVTDAIISQNKTVPKPNK